MIKIDIKLVAIGLLLIVVLLQQMCGGKHITPPPVIVTKIDTVYVTKTVVEYRDGKTIYQEKIIYREIPQNIDTLAILKDYFAMRVFNDKYVLLDSLGSIEIMDTISENKIKNRKITANVREKTITKTITTTITNPPKTQVYVGAGLGISKVEILNLVSAGVLIKTKNDFIYGLNIGITNSNNSTVTPFIGGGMYWKIKFRK